MRGVSGVVVAVLLTVISIVAVLIFWNTIACLVGLCPEPKILIENANLLAKQGLLTLTVKNIGSAATNISKVELLPAEQSGSSQGGSSGGGLSCNLRTQSTQTSSSGQTTQKTEVPPGASLTIQYNCGTGSSGSGQSGGQGLTAGATYYVIVYYKKGSTEVPTDPYPVTAR